MSHDDNAAHTEADTERDFQEKCRRMVQNEVSCCLSSLVATLANGAYCLPSKRHGMTDGADELGALAEQAAELCAPIDDWESAAYDAGWRKSEDGWRKPKSFGHLQHPGPIEALCNVEDIDPYEREVYEHWAVSNWLAEALQRQGERVDTDFAGLNVWARTTTGQAIYIDGVIRDVMRQLEADVAADKAARS